MQEVLSGRVLQLANLIVSEPPADVNKTFLLQLQEAVYTHVIPSALASALRNGVIPKEMSSD